jgi:hypothetical protein
MRDTQYELDREDRIRSVNAGWSAFARENEAEHLIDAVLGTSIWDWVVGVEVRHLYRLLFSRLRDTHGTTRFPFRCDSPGLRRFMELEIVALPDGGLRFSARLKRVERRVPVRVVDAHVARSEELVAICSWCRRVRADGELWLELEDAASGLRLLEDSPPAITHTICTDCEARFGDLG